MREEGRASKQEPNASPNLVKQLPELDRKREVGVEDPQALWYRRRAMRSRTSRQLT